MHDVGFYVMRFVVKVQIDLVLKGKIICHKTTKTQRERLKDERF
jgi:hypothetical protein